MTRDVHKEDIAHGMVACPHRMRVGKWLILLTCVVLSCSDESQLCIADTRCTCGSISLCPFDVHFPFPLALIFFLPSPLSFPLNRVICLSPSLYLPFPLLSLPPSLFLCHSPPLPTHPHPLPPLSLSFSLSLTHLHTCCNVHTLSQWNVWFRTVHGMSTCVLINPTEK